MFESVSQAAEHIATRASRREFLGRLGRGAMVAAATLGGVLALPAVSQGGRKPTLCGAESTASCSGKNVGDVCFEEFTGVCRASMRSGPACFCDFKTPRR